MIIFRSLPFYEPDLVYPNYKANLELNVEKVINNIFEHSRVQWHSSADLSYAGISDWWTGQQAYLRTVHLSQNSFCDTSNIFVLQS